MTGVGASMIGTGAGMVGMGAGMVGMGAGMVDGKDAGLSEVVVAGLAIVWGWDRFRLALE